MSSKETWSNVIDELEELSNRDEFRLIRGALERLLNLANATIDGQEGQKLLTPEQIRARLEEWKRVNQEIKGDANPLEAFSRVMPDLATGNPPPTSRDTAAYRAHGDVLDAERDIFKANQITKANNVFNNSVLYIESYKDMKRELDNILLEVVLFVMTKEEAAQLSSEGVFAHYNNPKYFQQFGQFQQKLMEEQVQDALERYGATPEEWQPFKDSTDTIAKLVQDGLKMVRDFRKPIVPSFVDIHTLTADTSEKDNRFALKLLREEGCLVIVDVISMQHPVIQRAYRRALLDVYPHIPVITIAPTDRVLRFEQEMINFIERQPDLEIIKRLDWDGDDSCREVSRHSHLRNWVKGQVPDILKRREENKRDQDNVQSSYKDADGAA